MYIGELAGRTTDRPANQAPHSSSSHCVHQTREPARPTTGRLGVGERCGRVGYTRKRECNIPAAYTIFTVKYAVGREKRGENRLTLNIIVLILPLDYFSYSRSFRWISIEKKEIDLDDFQDVCRWSRSLMPMFSNAKYLSVLILTEDTWPTFFRYFIVVSCSLYLNIRNRKIVPDKLPVLLWGLMKRTSFFFF